MAVSLEEDPKVEKSGSPQPISATKAKMLAPVTENPAERGEMCVSTAVGVTIALAILTARHKAGSEGSVKHPLDRDTSSTHSPAHKEQYYSINTEVCMLW